ncbi:MAG: quinoprotein dehydrogenase-associated SoxYZ-like carrier [Hyphomicrobium sp.]|jgi:sulfur-oxidizing protein SoxY
MQTGRTWKSVLGLALAALVAAGASAPVSAGDDIWQDIRRDVFDNRQVSEDGLVTLDAPYRAEDAAVVPLTMHIPASAGAVKSLTLIIDKNPSPVAATFEFGEAAGKGDRMLSTRVRIDSYSNVRAIAETADGTLHMATKFVKASGGCSAAAAKDADETLANLGKMQVRTFDSADAKDHTPNMREAQVMIRHPNATGMQMDQVTRQFTPMRIVSEMDVRRDGARIFKMEGGISISENPNFRFTYVPGSDNLIEVTAKDTEGKVFTATSAGKAS